MGVLSYLKKKAKEATRTKSLEELVEERKRLEKRARKVRERKKIKKLKKKTRGEGFLGRIKEFAEGYEPDYDRMYGKKGSRKLDFDMDDILFGKRKKR